MLSCNCKREDLNMTMTGSFENLQTASKQGKAEHLRTASEKGRKAEKKDSSVSRIRETAQADRFYFDLYIDRRGILDYNQNNH